MISVIVPNKNGAKYIKECLDSIVTQDYLEKEIIVVDGYSTDGSWKIIKSYPEIIAVRAEPKGEPDAINIGMRFAHGNILTYLDSDDYYPQGALSIVAEYFAAYNPKWAYGLGKVVDGNGKETRKLMMKAKEFLMRRYDYDILKIVDYLLQPAVYWSRELYNEVGVFNSGLKYTFEYEWWLRAGRKHEPLFIPHYIGRWRMHGGSITSGDLKQNAVEAFMVQKRYNRNSIVWLLQYCSYVVTRMIYAREKRA